MEPLNQRVALVTGAGGGIGRALAQALVTTGAETWLVGRNAESLAETALACGPGRVEVRALDLTEDSAIGTLVTDIRDAHGRLDILAHCAGIIAHGTLEKTPVESLDDQYRSNVRIFYSAAQQLLPLLRRGRGQVVVVNSSIVSGGPKPGTAQFAATQHALRALTDTFRNEVNADGIRVLSIYPGRTATARQERLYKEDERSYRPELLLQPHDIAAIVLSALTLPATAEVTDIHVRPMLKSY
jgi:NADP-dependent 3-hydroxy acid dehydrogenase YdfG